MEMNSAELAPAEVRGSLVALQQLAITFGIMVSFWIDYGTNFIGGTGNGQSPAAWRIPLALQLVPALILGGGILFMPFSPRWLINVGRDEEALNVLSYARRLPRDNELVQIEFLRENFPHYQDGSFKSSFLLGVQGYWSLLRNRGAAVMFFQQWTGVNAILYYAPFIFQDLGLTSNANSLLATGVVGIVMFLATIPAVVYVDKIGRKPVLISGAFLMATHRAAGWASCALVWIFAMGPCAWVIISEIFPMSVRGKGMSIAASSNWMNNFIVGQVPETSGKTLEEMDEVFGSEGLAISEAERLARIHKQIGLTSYSHDMESGLDEKSEKDSKN
ncbi:hypothetical protein Clacol_008719 [Clathrus columnatus]|uniref:Major facilitator superfamily (MFS) profile domain-containing protein n=1 Tax=Clathrus columnatus TaxID=1419009 RepID=A0AAV5ARE7_9AGAM|nr:hypothetical protein Clacol_008719 [Clathrus columnatus]